MPNKKEKLNKIMLTQNEITMVQQALEVAQIPGKFSDSMTALRVKFGLILSEEIQDVFRQSKNE